MALFCSRANHLCNFGGGYHAEQFCEIILNFDEWFRCRLKDLTATSFFLPHQNLAKSHHLSSGAKDSKPLNYIKTDIREQNIYNYA